MNYTNTRRGFTLIELLVVVIMIAILATIALVQYNKTVMKSRLAALKPIAKSVKAAQEIYYNREGKYAGESELADLDIGIPEGTSLDISATGEHQYVRANNPAGLPHNSYTMYFDQSENYAGNVYCEACDNDANATALCIAEGGTEGPVNGNCKLYLLQGNSAGGFAVTPIQAASVTCPDNIHENYSSCFRYELGDSNLEIDYRDDGSFSAYDPLAPGNGADYDATGHCLEGPACQAAPSFCTAYPNIDVCI